jgi:hypothetical protein
MLPDLGYPVYTMVYYSTPDIGDVTRLRLPCLHYEDNVSAKLQANGQVVPSGLLVLSGSMCF